MEKKNNGNYFLTILLAVFFGLAAGVSGGLMTRSSLLNDIYSIPFYGKIDFSSAGVRDNLVIKNAKNVVIKQDEQVSETIKSVSGSLVGIFKKISAAEPEAAAADNLKKQKTEDFVPAKNYRLNNNEAEGLIITSDGWLLVPDFGKDMTKEIVSKDYAAVTGDGTIYDIDDISKEKISGLVFVHLKDARDLPVRGFASRESLYGGQMAIAVDWNGRSFLTSVIGVEKSLENIKKSDPVAEKLLLADDLSKLFSSAFLFNLNGDFTALLKDDDTVIVVSDLSPLVRNFLDKKEKSRPSLGLNYVALSEFAILQDMNAKKGALIYPDAQGVAIVKGGAAEKAGLKEGDLIVSIDNMEINKDNELSRLLGKYSAGDEISLVYRRGEAEERIKIILDQLK